MWRDYYHHVRPFRILRHARRWRRMYRRRGSCCCLPFFVLMLLPFALLVTWAAVQIL